MTLKAFFILSVIFCVNKSWSQKTPPHLDMDATSREYEVYLSQMPPSVAPPDAEDIEVEQWLKYGARNLQWVAAINAQRPASQQISLTSAATQPANPISNPRIYNFKIIKASWTQLQNQLPTSLKNVIFGTAAITANIPVPEDEFVQWLLKVDSAYQISARYKLRKPWREIMSTYIVSDVRGYLNIKADANINKKLSTWSTLDSALKKKLTQDLLNICWNSGAWMIDCRDAFDAALKKQTLIAFKDKYMPSGLKNYNKFFLIGQKRNDVQWSSSNPNTMTIPFTNPSDSTILNFLKTNIEDEWKWKNWKLKLNFITTTSLNTTHVKFVPGSVPSVNGLAGSTITMDKNSPLTEFGTQWTIRHEYGHVLGFPDCYLEFYDNALTAFVSYQIDIDNLMCSRRGHLMQTHYDQLKKAYYK